MNMLKIMGIRIRNDFAMLQIRILFFQFMKIFEEQKGIVFHGTADPWVETTDVVKGCRERNLPLYITEGGNHSLETGDVLKDIQNLREIMEKTTEFL